MPPHFHHNKEIKIDKNPKMSHDDPHLSALSSAPKEFIAISLPSPRHPRWSHNRRRPQVTHKHKKKKTHRVPNTGYALIEAATLTVILTLFFFLFSLLHFPKGCLPNSQDPFIPIPIHKQSRVVSFFFSFFFGLILCFVRVMGWCWIGWWV